MVRISPFYGDVIFAWLCVVICTYAFARARARVEYLCAIVRLYVLCAQYVGRCQGHFGRVLWSCVVI